MFDEVETNHYEFYGGSVFNAELRKALHVRHVIRDWPGVFSIVWYAVNFKILKRS